MSFQLDGASVPWPSKKWDQLHQILGDILGMSETRLGFGHRGISATKNGNMGIWV